MNDAAVKSIDKTAEINTSTLQSFDEVNSQSPVSTDDAPKARPKGSLVPVVITIVLYLLVYFQVVKIDITEISPGIMYNTSLYNTSLPV